MTININKGSTNSSIRQTQPNKSYTSPVLHGPILLLKSRKFFLSVLKPFRKNALKDEHKNLELLNTKFLKFFSKILVLKNLTI
jgi:hypothetical protein